jgi:DNA-binding transcriptional regulator YdaS (Cro superfamily)
MRETSAAAENCPLAPPEHASVYSRALHRACLILGGLEQLARRLEVSDVDLRRWLAGDLQPPERVFLEAVEVVLLHSGTTGRAN